MKYEYIELENEEGLALRGVRNSPENLNERDTLPAIAIIHGHTGNKLGNNFFFVKMSKYFTNKGFITFRFDLNGTGESDGEFENMTLTSEIKDMNVIMEYIKNDNNVKRDELFIIGHSMGGLITTLQAYEYKPKKIILLAPANDMYNSVLDMYNTYGENLNEIKYSGLKIKKEFMMDMEKYRPYDKARLYRGDVLILRGSDDVLVTLYTCKKTKNAFLGNVKYIELNGTDHSFTDYDAREKIMKEIYNFIEV